MATLHGAMAALWVDLWVVAVRGAAERAVAARARTRGLRATRERTTAAGICCAVLGAG